MVRRTRRQRKRNTFEIKLRRCQKKSADIEYKYNTRHPKMGVDQFCFYTLFTNMGTNHVVSEAHSTIFLFLDTQFQRFRVNNM